MSLVSPSHMFLVSRIENATKSKMTRGQIPADIEVLKVRLRRALNTFLEEPGKESIASTWVRAADGLVLAQETKQNGRAISIRRIP